MNAVGRVAAPGDDELSERAWQSRIANAVERCRANGWRLTPIRQRTLELVCRSTRVFKAYELLDRIGDAQVIASPMRVYRALEFLTRHGFVRHLKTINAFIWCDGPQQVAGFPFLICDHCESATALSDPDAGTQIIERASRYGFTVNPGTMELRGICRECTQRRAG